MWDGGGPMAQQYHAAPRADDCAPGPAQRRAGAVRGSCQEGARGR